MYFLTLIGQPVEEHEIYKEKASEKITVNHSLFVIKSQWQSKNI